MSRRRVRFANDVKGGDAGDGDEDMDMLERDDDSTPVPKRRRSEGDEGDQQVEGDATYEPEPQMRVSCIFFIFLVFFWELYTDLRLFGQSDRAYLDLGSAITRLLTEDRIFRRRQCDFREVDFLQPSPVYKRFVLPSSELLDQPATGLNVRYCHTSIAKIRFPVFSLVWSPEGRRIITGSQNKEFTLWSSFGFIADSTIGSHSVVRCMKFTRSGEYMAAVDMDGNCRYFSPQLRLQNEFRAHDLAAREVSFSPTDLKLVTCSDDCTAKVWDFDTGTEEMTLKGHSFEVKTSQWHPHKSLIVTGSRDNLIKLWNPRAGKELMSISGHKNTISALRWNPINGNWFCSVSRDKTVRLFDLRMIRRQDPCLFVCEGHNTEVYSADWHPHHESVLATGSYDGALIFWNMYGPDKHCKVQATTPAAHEGSIWSLAWAPGGHLLASGSQDKTSKIWSRMRPGMEALLLYKGFARNVDELDVLRQASCVPPTFRNYESFVEQKENEISNKTEIEEMEKAPDANEPQELQIDVVLGLGKENFDKTLSQKQLVRDIATKRIPSVTEEIGMEDASKQAGLVLVPPKVFFTFNDGQNYDPNKLDNSEYIRVMRGGILDKQDPNAAATRDMIASGDASLANLGGAAGGASSSGFSAMGNGPVGDTQQTVDLASLPEPRQTGFVKMFDESKGYGFVRPHESSLPDLFAQRSDILPGHGKDGEQRFDRMDVVVFRVEVGENRRTGTEQYKARQIIWGEYDKERVQKQKDSHIQAQRRSQSRGPSRGQQAGPPPPQQQQPNYYQQQQQQQQQPPPPPPPPSYGGRPPQQQPPAYAGGPPPPPPQYQASQQQRPRISPEQIIWELQQNQDNPARIDEILRHYGISHDEVERMIMEHSQGM